MSRGFSASTALFALVILVWVPSAHSAAPASAPADQVDQNTQDILKELDAGRSAAPAATSPAAPTETNEPSWS